MRNSLTPVQHPAFCDPRVHIQHAADDVEHRSAGLSWKPAAADTELTVQTAQLEVEGERAPAVVRLTIADLIIATSVGSDLDPADARMLAAALVCEAERVEALQRHLRVA